MLNAEENDLLTRVGAGTPAGELLRRYWHPIAPPASELTAEKPKKKIRLLGEDLVVFRDGSGQANSIAPLASAAGISQAAPCGRGSGGAI